MYPHRIRLRGPWTYEPVNRRAGDVRQLPERGRMTMPARWAEGGLADFAGRVHFERRFGYPGQIDAHERVWLTFAGVSDHARVWLNGTYLGEHAGGGVEFEVTALLQPRNVMMVEVEGDEQGGLWGEVALEVRASAYLRHVAVQKIEDEIRVTGEVVGESEGQLELYLIADRSPAGYSQVTATPDGKGFLLSCSAIATDGNPVKVVKLDLVCGATSWYTVEQTL